MEISQKKIEELVRARDTFNAKKLISQWLSKSSKNADFSIAIQWYRRLSLYREALLLCLKLNPFDSLSSTSVKLMTAEALSVLGAHKYSLQLIDSLNLETPDDNDLAGAIYLAANNYSQSKKCFEKYIDICADKKSYKARLNRLSICDCLSRLNLVEESIAKCNEILSETHEPLLRAICFQALGEYHCRIGHYKKAKIFLKRSEAYFNKQESEDYDSSLLYRWQGFLEAKLGKKKSGKSKLLKSIKIIKKIGLREEIWFENIFLLDELNLISKTAVLRAKYFPLDPKISSPPRERLISIGRSNSVLIHLSENYYSVNSKNYLGIPKEVLLLGYLKIAKEWGIGLELIKTLLWPAEAHSYLQLEDRIHHILSRIRKNFNVKCKIKKNRAYLVSTAAVGVTINFREELPRLLENENGFSSKDLRKIFILKRTQAAVHLNNWLLKGWITKKGSGRSIKYHIVPFSKKSHPLTG